MCAVTNVAFKKQVVDSTAGFNPDWFSVVDQSNSIAPDVEVGKNTLINLFNSIYAGAVIGNHVTITNFNSLSHGVIIDEMCHISPYTYVCYTHLGKGVCVGLRSSFAGKPDKPISVTDWCNITMDSRITESITKTGTWYGNRRVNSQSSLDVKLL
jgi:bifunctional N-acetylglucosamine-1-phosphate-uridyltransferase/glucosamine-1-phosphate-acetyltransferase GlmU-like protein